MTYLVQLENGKCFSWGRNMLRYDKISVELVAEYAADFDDAADFEFGQAQKISSVLDTLGIINEIVECPPMVSVMVDWRDTMPQK